MVVHTWQYGTEAWSHIPYSSRGTGIGPGIFLHAFHVGAPTGLIPCSEVVYVGTLATSGSCLRGTVDILADLGRRHIGAEGPRRSYICGHLIQS